MINRIHIHLSLLVCTILEIIPMPISFGTYRPDWLLMGLVFWNMFHPQNMNIGIAFLYGLVLDVLLGYTLGMHALAFSLVMYVASIHHLRFKNYSIWQQSGILGLYTAFYNMVLFWLQHWLNDAFFHLNYFWPIATTMFLWPWCFWLLNRVRRERLRH